jgi:hypothetical protein
MIEISVANRGIVAMALVFPCMSSSDHFELLSGKLRLCAPILVDHFELLSG